MEHLIHVRVVQILVKTICCQKVMRIFSNQWIYGIDEIYGTIIFLDNRVVELYTVVVTWVGEFYFVYNSHTRLYFFVDLFIRVSQNDSCVAGASQWNDGMSCICWCMKKITQLKKNEKQNKKTYIFQLHDYLTYIFHRHRECCRGNYTV